MLGITEFAQVIINDLSSFLPEAEDVTVELVDVVKINDQHLTGITIRASGENAAATLYLDDLFIRCRNGEPVSKLMAEIATSYERSKDCPKPPELELNWEFARTRLLLKLVEQKRNQKFLETHPYMDMGCGLAVVVDIGMDESCLGEWRVSVNNEVLSRLGVDQDTLFETAFLITMFNAPPKLVDMNQMLFSSDEPNVLRRSEPIELEHLSNMYVLTNTTGTFGAVTLFYPTIMEKIGMLLGSYFVLPSSLHELIIVPDKGDMKPGDLIHMVKEANLNVVEPKDILSDEVYRYDIETQSLSQCSSSGKHEPEVA